MNESQLVIFPQFSAMNEQSVNQSLHEFWTRMAGVNTLLVDASHFYDFLQTQFNHMLTKNYDIPPNKGWYMAN